MASDEEEMQEVRRKSAPYASAGIATEILDSQMLAEAEPHLRQPLAGALLVPSDAVLYPPCAAAYLLGKRCGWAHGSIREKHCRRGRATCGLKMEPNFTRRAL